jgi:hypothetical protein
MIWSRMVYEYDSSVWLICIILTQNRTPRKRSGKSRSAFALHGVGKSRAGHFPTIACLFSKS